MSEQMSYSRRDFIALGTGAALSAAVLGQAQTAAPVAAPVRSSSD
ncbi:MAG: hypothetical protein NTY53_03115 [Kiritimatiellaeota bacterium]|nr:hypothetical protein [Kiritimatiellota bacterium]